MALDDRKAPPRDTQERVHLEANSSKAWWLTATLAVVGAAIAFAAFTTSEMQTDVTPIAVEKSAPAKSEH